MSVVQCQDYRESSVSDKIGHQTHLNREEAELVRNLTCDTCKTYVRTFLGEVRRLPQVYPGEDEILGSANAMCFGVLQKYSIDANTRAIVEYKDEHAGRLMLVFKKACDDFNEEYGSYVAEFIYKKLRESKLTGKQAGREFCGPKEVCTGRKEFPQKKKTSKKIQKETLPSAKKDRPMPQDFLNAMQEMQNDPLSFFTTDERIEIVQRSKAITCPVCRKLVITLPKYRDETRIIEALETICDSEYKDEEIVQTALPNWLDKFDTITGSQLHNQDKKRQEDPESHENFKRNQTLIRTCRKVARMDDLAERIYTGEGEPCREVCTGKDEL